MAVGGDGGSTMSSRSLVHIGELETPLNCGCGRM